MPRVDSFYRRILTGYLCLVPLGTFPEFCVADQAGRRQLLSSRDMSELWKQFRLTQFWYLRYVFHFLTAPLRRKPNFFITGFPKCGTTYLADRLSRYANIDTPTSLATISKETLHYRKDQPIHAFMPIRGFYPFFSKAEYIFDASVSYSLDPGAMAWINRDHPQAKAILVVRDQISAFESGINYYQMQMWRSDIGILQVFEDPQTFRQVPMDKIEQVIDYSWQHQCSMLKAMRAEIVQKLLADGGPAARRFVSLRYDRWVKFHLDVFGKDRLLVIDFADLIRQPEKVVARITRFLGMPALFGAVAEQTRQFNRNSSRKVFRLNADSRRALADVFRPHNEKLREMTDVELNRHMDVQNDTCKCDE